MDIFQALVLYEGHTAMKCPPEWSWQTQRNGWDGLVLWLVTQGEGEMIAPDRVYPLCAGDCFLLRMREVHCATQHSDHSLVVHCLHFDFCAPDGHVMQPGFESLPRYRRIHTSSLLGALMDRALNAKNEGRTMLAEHWLRSALLLVQEADASGETKAVIPIEQAIEIDNICRHIEGNPQVWYTIEELAARMHCTSDHFIRLFRAYRHMTPGRFIITARLEEAKKLLRFTDTSIMQIAAVLRYGNPYFFSRQFRHFVGISPSHYRRQAGFQ